MTHLTDLYREFFVSDREAGASMVEYALLVVLIAVIAMVAVVLVGESVSTTFSTVASELDAG